MAHQPGNGRGWQLGTFGALAMETAVPTRRTGPVNDAARAIRTETRGAPVDDKVELPLPLTSATSGEVSAQRYRRRSAPGGRVPVLEVRGRLPARCLMTVCARRARFGAKVVSSDRVCR
jgi:hypothetical protein